MSGPFWSVLRAVGSISATPSILLIATWSSVRTAWIVYGVIVAFAVVGVIAYEVGRNSPAGAERPE